MSPLAQPFFEQLYRDDIDPWGYATSPYERAKYQATLAACGPGPFNRALELGASIGVFTELLAPRCRALAAIDGAPTAVAATRSRLSGLRHVSVICGAIPEDLPGGQFDLVVASEVLYYLDPDGLMWTCDALERRTATGSRLVAVHWRTDGPERPLRADTVHGVLESLPWLEPIFSAPSEGYLLDVFERP